MISISNILIYVAGPLTTGCFRPTGAFDMMVWEENVRKAEAVWLELQSYGFAAICVHTMGRYALGRVPEEHAIAADFVILDRCDAIVLVEGWSESKGTLGEIKRALEHNKPVFKTIDEAVEWRSIRVTIDPKEEP